jgi:AraC family transcriptional regulator, regulatory protein of adaptative response / methylated-DNA-[protein]-cysteine methyltransferase
MQFDTDHDRIANAIDFLKQNYKQQPTLEQAAAHVHLSPFHFQRMFTEWAGISPKQFIRYLTIEHARNILAQDRSTLFDAALTTGLSGTGRLHDLFIKIEGMTPGEYKNGGEHLQINYSFADTPFGRALIASTSKGICYMAFTGTDDSEALVLLRTRFPKARYEYKIDQFQQNALTIFTTEQNGSKDIKLHLKGTPFQLKVWEALLKIPMGDLTTYNRLAGKINNPKANRAVGSAVGDNPVAFLIPCHRVIRSTGETGQYHWGSKRKTAMIGWEAAQILPNDQLTSTSAHLDQL